MTAHRLEDVLRAVMTALTDGRLVGLLHVVRTDARVVFRRIVNDLLTRVRERMFLLVVTTLTSAHRNAIIGDVGTDVQ
jgi:hypothetical protein